MQPQTRTRPRLGSNLKAYKNTPAQVLIPAATAIVRINTEYFDLLDEFDTTTWTFTAKRTGYYLILVGVSTLNAFAPIHFVSGININGVAAGGIRFYEDAYVGSINTVYPLYFHLNEGDTITVYVTNASANNISINQSTNNFLAIRRLY